MRKELWLALAVLAGILLVHGLHRHPVGANQSARIFGAFAFVEPGPDQGTFRIDSIVTPGNPRGVFTRDWAKHGEHYYSNKAPGSTLLAVPALWLVRLLERLCGMDPDAQERIHIQAHWVNFLTTSFLLAFAAAWNFRRRMQRGWSEADALSVPLVFAFGSLVFSFSLSYWGHPMAAAFTLLALTEIENDSAPATVGFAAGLSLLVEYTAALNLLLLGLFYLRRSPAWPGRNLRRTVQFLLGATVPAAALLALHWMLFGHPLTTAFSLTNPVYMGEAKSAVETFLDFEPARLWHLTFGMRRGLFWFSPVLLLAFLPRPPRPERLPRTLLLAGFIPYLLVIAAFNGWHGGNSTGPRYLLAAVPFLLMALPRWSSLRISGKALAAGLATVSFGVAWCVAITGVNAPFGFRNPFFEAVLPALFNPSASAAFWPLQHHKGGAIVASLVLTLGTLAGLLLAARGTRPPAGPQKFSEKS